MVRFSREKWLQAIVALMLCHYISCDCLLPELNFGNGTVKLPDSYKQENLTSIKELSIIQYTCSDGYILIGTEFLQCRDDKWTNEAPFCSERTCPYPPTVENAISVIHHGNKGEPVIGSSVVYSCREGYEVVNPNGSTLRCRVNVESRMTSWEGEIPSCKEKTKCPDPGVSPHGERSGDCCSLGNTLSFSCNEGYELVGDREMHCRRNGVWSSSRPRCRPLRDYCEFPSPITNGVLSGDKKGDYFIPNEEAEVVCESGFKCEGKKSVVCGEDGKWEHDFGVCKEIFCDRPAPIAHGTIPELRETNLTTFPYGFEISYFCDKGYRIYSGDSWRTCGTSGWSGMTPRCEVVRCPDPGTPDNGTKIGTDYTVGSTVTFSCLPGFDLLGSIEILCSTNGQWIGEVARCNMPSNYCPDPGTPINGFKNMTNYIKGDRVLFGCQDGHILLGSEIRECLPNKTWSGTRTRCVGQYDFDHMEDISYSLTARLDEIREQQRTQEVEIDALRNATDMSFPEILIMYFIFDISGSITKSNFEKRVELAKAIIRKMGISMKGARVGAIAFSSKGEDWFSPHIHDSTEDVIVSLNMFNYTGGESRVGSCLNWIRTESIPLVKQWLGDPELQFKIFVFSDGKISMGSDYKKEADILKAEGAEIFGIGITGDVGRKALYDIASASQIGDEIKPNVFILQDYSKEATLAQKITNGTTNYSKCGLRMRSTDVSTHRVIGNESIDAWPWMAAVYLRRSDERFQFWCGGSIIHKKFILTAAHCLFARREIFGKLLVHEIKANEIIVRLGLKDLSDKTYLKQYEVRKIRKHEGYVYGDFMDYDIALLEIKGSIEYNAFVRPICLPEEVIPEKFYKPQSIIRATGWGHTEDVPKYASIRTVVSPVLMEVDLRIQSPKTCTESLRDDNKVKNFTPRMFCAGSGQKKGDTCTGDSGGPAMQNQLDDESGGLEWTQVGIVSWGLGCNVQNEYGFYTHVKQLMPWIRDKIKEALEWMEE